MDLTQPRIVMLDLLVMITALVILLLALWKRFVKHNKVLNDPFILCSFSLVFGVGNLLDHLKIIPSEFATFIIIFYLLAIIMYGLIFVSRRTAASKSN